jgi:flagellar protein FliS
MNNAYRVYQQNQVQTISQEKLVVMLYDGILKFIKLAKAAMDQNDLEKTHNYLCRAEDILRELMVTLNMEAGEISRSLFRLYDYMVHRLVQANVKKDVTVMDEVLQMAGELRETWQQAMLQLRSCQAQVVGSDINYRG